MQRMKEYTAGLQAQLTEAIALTLALALALALTYPYP